MCGSINNCCIAAQAKMDMHTAGAYRQQSSSQRGAGQAAGQVQVAAPGQAALREVQAAAVVLGMGWRTEAGWRGAKRGAWLGCAGRSSAFRQRRAGGSAVSACP